MRIAKTSTKKEIISKKSVNSQQFTEGFFLIRRFQKPNCSGYEREAKI